MSKYRNRLPQLGNGIFVTDGGLETTLIYHDGIDLPAFAAFDLLKDDAGLARLRNYFARYAEIARSHRMGLVLEAPTWRANRDWAEKLGYDALALEDANRKAIGLLLEIRAAYETADTKIVISGQLGPRGDGYVPSARMTAREAQAYHLPQIRTFAQTDADMVAAFMMNYVEEAIGIAHAAKTSAMPVAISFTLETDGRLPSGDTLERAIAATDGETDSLPRLLHDQLRASDSLRECAAGRRRLARSHSRPARECVQPQPRRAGSSNGPRCRQSGRTWRRVPRVATAVAAARGGRWLLRHR
jgi:homocysteine S-methyltransferase